MRYRIGDVIKWDGSGDRCYPRYYIGTVYQIQSDGLIIAIDHEWGARNGISPRRVVDIVERSSL